MHRSGAIGVRGAVAITPERCAHTVLWLVASGSAGAIARSGLCKPFGGAITSTLAFSNLNQETAGYITGKDAYKDDQLKDSNPNPEAYRDAKSVRWASRIDYRVDEGQRFSVTPS